VLAAEGDGRGLARVGLQHGEVAVDDEDARVDAAAVGEGDRGLVPADGVRDGQDAPRGDDDAGPGGPAAAEADDGRPDALGQLGHEAEGGGIRGDLHLASDCSNGGSG
jgi:hypothetical protein